MSDIPFIDLRPQYARMAPHLQARMDRVFAHQCFVLGPEVGELEAKLAAYVGVARAVTASSGTDALLMALMAAGVGPGDEVITPAFSFASVVAMTLLLGATPVLVDIDPRTYLMSVSSLESAITDKTRAIVPVGLYGQCADFDAIAACVQRMAAHPIVLIDDMAQSFGATYRGRRAGSLAHISCTSFYPSKPLGCYGDGGACFTDDVRLADDLCQLRNHGQQARYSHTRLGINGRLDTLQAVVLLEKLAFFDEEVQLRQRVAADYTARFNAAQLPVQTPVVSPHNTSVFAQYTLGLEARIDREALRVALSQKGVPIAVHYPLPLHHQPAYQARVRQAGTLLVSEQASRTVLSLPMHPYLTDTVQDRIVHAFIRSVQETLTTTLTTTACHATPTPINQTSTSDKEI